MVTEGLALHNARNVYLYRWDRDAAQGIGDREAGVRVGCGIDDDAVKLSVSGLDRINDRTLVID